MRHDPLKIEVVRDLDTSLLDPLDDEEASTEDGMMLNHVYVDVRGCDISDLDHTIEEEVAFYSEVSELAGDERAIAELLDEHALESESPFDIGVTAAVVAISYAGGAPITSCNGGWFGRVHSSGFPHVLFSIAGEDIGPLPDAAEVADCGLTNDGPHAELYADDLPKLLRFAQAIRERAAA